MRQNGLGTIRNEFLAFRWMSLAAKQGHNLAFHGLGLMYLEGDCVEQDEYKAAEWLSRGVEQDLEGSMITLAQLYEEGRGVEKNLEYAQELYQRAGYLESQT